MLNNQINGLNISQVNVGMIRTNCFIVYGDSREAIIIDPGDDAHKIYAKVEELNVQPKAILLTHGHFDHIMAVDKVRQKYNIDVYAGNLEKALLADERLNGSGEYRRDCVVTQYKELVDGQVTQLAGITIKVISTPGHTAGSVCYLVDSAKVLFSGDTLFRESVGRTDLATGNERDIINSLNNRLMSLEDDIVVYPGHGQSTTIGYERENNVFIV